MANNNLALLKNYRNNVFELAAIEQELHDSIVHDAVQSAAKHPYSKHSVPVDGVPPSEDAYRKQIRAQELRQEIRKAKQIVKMLPFQLRRAAEMYYLWPILTGCEEVDDEAAEHSWDHKPKWEEVADKIGNGATGEALKKAIQREMKKI